LNTDVVKPTVIVVRSPDSIGQDVADRALALIVTGGIGAN